MGKRNYPAAFCSGLLMGDLALAMFNPRFNGGFLDGFLKERSASC
jgi:hypothetical protein